MSLIALCCELSVCECSNRRGDGRKPVATRGAQGPFQVEQIERIIFSTADFYQGRSAKEIRKEGDKATDERGFGIGFKLAPVPYQSAHQPHGRDATSDALPV